jgi:hypothetical protein
MPDETTPPPGDQGANDGGGQPPAGTTTSTAGDEDGLGEAGKRALDAERTSRRAAEKRAADMEKELQRFRESSMSEQEKAIEQARKEARTEATAAFNQRLVAAEVRAVAAGKLADPEDAIRFLDLDDFKVGDAGEVDKTAITKALDGLVKAKPYLAASATRPTGDADQGARGGPAGSSMNDLIRAARR